MSTYLGPVAVKAKAKMLGIAGHEQPPIPKGQRLVAIMTNGALTVAPDVTEKRDYEAAMDAYAKGRYFSPTLFLLPEEEVRNCPSEGRVFMSLKDIQK